MSQPDIVTPVATAYTSQCRITPPWFVQYTEYFPVPATYKPLINGEEAFAAVHNAIANAKKSVDIICWGFQPSMYFIRDGKSPCIGELLVKIAREKNVEVRILGWEMPFNSAGMAGEANLPGRGTVKVKDRAGQSATETQYLYDLRWYEQYGNPSVGELVLPAYQGLPTLKDSFPQFVGRGFSAEERAEIAWRLSRQSVDKELSAMSIGIMTGSVTHHQKTVLVDYELPERAIGFVMGHNMLDEYWDTDAHTALQRQAPDKPAPNAGPRGFLPRQDISSQVTGPILEHLHANFAKAWRKETGVDLLASRNAMTVACKLKPRTAYGTPLMAQLLRTQAQEGRRDIERLYLQAVNNATQFIYIENQYFRWPPLAEAIKKAAADQLGGGRKPEEHGSLHLFVVTNVTDEGIGAGTLNTQRMLESLGRADTIPEITKLRQIEQVDKEFISSGNGFSLAGSAAMDEKLDEYHRRVQAIKDKDAAELVEERPGLKVHICSLVAPDSPPGNWMPVYIHSKLMIIDDVFTTHGSANINTRSMQVDSEMNIAHEWASVTTKMRRRLWGLHTKGMGAQDDPEKAFISWGDILSENNDFKDKGKQPEASLIKFIYDKATIKDWD